MYMRERERERESIQVTFYFCSICVLHKMSTLVTSVGVSLPPSTLLRGLTESVLWSTFYRMVLMSMLGTRGKLL